MPRGDGTGPQGLGPMTGRGMGFCAGSRHPGFMSSAVGRGMAFGRGRAAGGGCGMAYGRRAGAACFQAPSPANQTTYSQPNASNEKEALENEADVLKKELNMIKKRLEELEKEEKDEG